MEEHEILTVRRTLRLMRYSNDISQEQTRCLAALLDFYITGIFGEEIGKENIQVDELRSVS
ncbi:MAG: hypothetical protein MRY79_06420 [Alphaproteobacteria bacterium]|nr:hypothetical protein [Alphaproteobacteria bacterium]